MDRDDQKVGPVMEYTKHSKTINANEHRGISALREDKGTAIMTKMTFKSEQMLITFSRDADSFSVICKQTGKELAVAAQKEQG